MKYVIALVLGMFVGAALFALALIYNPLTGDTRLSPLTVTDAEVISLSYAAVPTESLVYTNDGESLQQPHPPKVAQLWEPPIRQTSAAVAVMHDARGRPAGIGVKVSSRSESSELLRGDAIFDSAWYIYLPEHGGLFIGQSENYWEFLREVAFPAWRSSANTWRGAWTGNLTSGPGVLGTAYAYGSSGRLEDLEMEVVESLSVQAFSSDQGLISAEGRLIIALPEVAAELPED
jgi:hypothetical protein